MAAVFPETLYIEVTNRCNSKCATCVRTFDLAEPEGDFPLDDIRRLVASFPRGLAPRRVVLNGVGEALLHRDLVEIVALLASAGAAVLFNTNAITLTPALVLALSDAGLAELRVSIDGARRETYHALRGVDALERAAENTRAAIAALREAGRDAPRISIWFTGTRDNLAELPEMVRLSHWIGASELYFQRLVFRDDDRAFGVARPERSLVRRALEERERAAFSEARALARELGVRLAGAGNAADPEQVVARAEGARPWSSCQRPERSTYITANGNVLPCCIAPFSTSDYAAITLGTLRDSSLQEIWRSRRYEEFRDRFASDDPVDCCRRCGADWPL
jgi:radical SAM protein with 4Fe4S-binding SPASM domain